MTNHIQWKMEQNRGIAFEYGKGDMKYKELRGNTDTDKYILTLYKQK